MKSSSLVSRIFTVFAAMLLYAGVTHNAAAAGYTVSDGKILDANGQEIKIKGINHFGFNSGLYGIELRPTFLWKMGWKEQIAQIKDLGFNSIRLPIVPDTLHSSYVVDNSAPNAVYVDPALNPELMGKTPLQVLDLWMAEANRQGMYVVLDFYSVTMKGLYPHWFVDNPTDIANLVWNQTAYTPASWRQDLTLVASRYAGLPYFMGIDIYNEPNYLTRWSTGSSQYQWKLAAESAATSILAANPNLLIFVEGIFDSSEDPQQNPPLSINFGENLQPQADPLRALNIQADKLVLAPHSYGPDVYPKDSFNRSLHPNFPANLPAEWDILFGRLHPAQTVVMGEWGGKYQAGTDDRIWQDAFKNYMVGKGICNSFYWAYTPNSEGSGGILYEVTPGGELAVNADKMALLNSFWSSCGASLNIFTDAMTPAWVLSSWSATPTIQTSFKKSGTAAIKADVTSSYGGVTFDSRDGMGVWTDIPANTYAKVSFDISAGPTVSPMLNKLEVNLDLPNGVSKKISDIVPSFAANTWYHVEIPLSEMNPQAVPFRRVMFFDADTSPITFYIDNLKLIGGAGSPPPPPPPPATLQNCSRIMPLGDSITHANGMNGGYRRTLLIGPTAQDGGLQQNNCGVTFVGSQDDNDPNEPWGYSPVDIEALRPHEGHSGWSIENFLGETEPNSTTLKLQTWLGAQQPDIILLMAGTNDIAAWTARTAEQIADEHTEMVDKIRQARPGAWIFIASIPPQTTKWIHGAPDNNTGGTTTNRAVLTQEFNAAMRSRVEFRMTTDPKIRFVDVNAVLNVATDINPDPDGIHPNTGGQIKIGQKFLEAIRAALAP